MAASLIIEEILPGKVDAGLPLIEADLLMLVCHNGQERTLAEYEELLAREGFCLESVGDTGSSDRLIAASAVPEELRGPMSSGLPGRHDPMNLSQNRLSVITLFAEDLSLTKSFYRDILGLQVLFDGESQAVFKLQNLVVNLTGASDPLKLIAPAAVASREAGSRVQLVIEVDDVDAACAELARHGVTLLNGPEDRPWGVRTASFTDPAGHIWEVARDTD